MSVQTVGTPAELQAIADQGKLVVIDFFATWCGPCVGLTPHFAKLAAENTDVNFVKIDVDQAGELAESFSVEAMPTILFMKGGAQLDKVVGANLPAIKGAVEKHK